jgi:DNA-binding NtrC family response regulator
MCSGPVLRIGDLPTQLQQQALVTKTDSTTDHSDAIGNGESLAVKTLADLEREAILGTIRKLNGDKVRAAKLLGIGKTTLYRKLKEYGVEDPQNED